MPSQSRSQQRLMGVAYAVKSGDMQLSDVDSEYRDKVKELVDGMSLKDLKDFASTPHEGLPEVVENVTPDSIGGMGQVQLPTETEVGSGDIPAGRGDAKKRYKKKMKFKHKIATYEEFLSKEDSQINEAKFKAGQVWIWKHADGDKEVEVVDVKSNGDVVGRVKGTSQDFIVRDANKWLKKKVSESVEVNEAVVDLQKYVEDASKKTFKNGGNGQNLLDNAMELARHIDSYTLGRNTRGYEEDGFYEPVTIALFKKLVDSMSADDIKNNSEDQYESVEVNEARSLNKIQKDFTAVTSEMSEVVLKWKDAKGSGDAKAAANLLARLKDLTAKKKGFEREMDEFVMGKDRNAELVDALESVNVSIFESMMAEIDIIAQEAKDFKDFSKKVMKEFKLEDDKDLFAWLKSLYDNRS